MAKQSRFDSLVLASVCALGSMACVDPEGSFNDFVDRSKALGVGGTTADAGDCTPPAPGEVEGNVFLAVSLSIAKTLPVTLAGTLESPEVNGRPSILLKLSALNYSDRKTPVQTEIIPRGPYVIDETGSFTAELPQEVIPAAANAVTKQDSESQVTLTGKVCGKSDFYCGTLVAQIIQPALPNVQGTYALTFVDDLATIPPDPVYINCEREVAAPPPTP